MTLQEFLNSKVGKKRSQSAWARYFGVNRGYFNQLARGNKSPSLDLALHLDAVSKGVIDIRSWPYRWPPEGENDGRDRANELSGEDPEKE